MYICLVLKGQTQNCAQVTNKLSAKARKSKISHELHTPPQISKNLEFRD